MDRVSEFVKDNAKDLTIGLSVVALLFAMAYKVRQNNIEKKLHLGKIDIELTK